MKKILIAVAAFGPLLACASAARSSRISSAVNLDTPVAAEPATEPSYRETERSAIAAMLADMPQAPSPRPAPARPGHYAVLKGGALYPSDGDIDAGYFVGGVFGQYVNPHVSFEIESGYAEANYDLPGGDLAAIPMLMNARVTFPVAFLDLYGGGGLGSTYYDLETSSFDVEGWLFAWDFFAGAEVVIRQNMTVGVELKYYMTEEIDRTDDRLDSLAVMATFGWRF